MLEGPAQTRPVLRGDERPGVPRRPARRSEACSRPRSSSFRSAIRASTSLATPRPDKARLEPGRPRRPRTGRCRTGSWMPRSWSCCCSSPPLTRGSERSSSGCTGIPAPLLGGARRAERQAGHRRGRPRVRGAHDGRRGCTRPWRARDGRRGCTRPWRARDAAGPRIRATSCVGRGRTIADGLACPSPAAPRRGRRPPRVLVVRSGRSGAAGAQGRPALTKPEK